MSVQLKMVCDLIADDSYAMTFQTFGQYRTALIKNVNAFLPAGSPGEDQFERLRPDFERLVNKNAACGLKRSRRGTYVNPAIARDWKWFQLGAIAKAHQGAAS